MSYFRIVTTLVFGAGVLGAQVDLGPRPGLASAGGYYPTLNAAEQALFSQAQGVSRK